MFKGLGIRILFSSAVLAVLCATASAQTATGDPDAAPVSKAAAGKAAPVGLTADSLQHDETGQKITAAGHVELVQGERILKADKIVYDLSADQVTAQGNVVLTEPNGDVHFADEAGLNTEMKEGFVKGLQSWLTAGGKFKAGEGEKKGSDIIMRNASYTPCDCDEDENGSPTWQIRADEVIYHQDENRISYKNAKFEVFGIPIAWLPFLSHGDGKVKRKSGFLTPDAGYDSRLGAVVTENYYWDIAPDKDATIGVMLTTKESPVALAGYRQRFANAEIEMNGSATHSSRVDSVAGQDVVQDEEWRGHAFAEGLWDINNKWRAGADLELASDDQYLRQYDFSSKDVLENQIYAERFSGRNYTVARVLGFQDVRVREEKTDQPNILPEVAVSMLGDPNGLLGGRWSADLSFLGLQRDGSGQDMNRISGTAGWQTRAVTDFGLVNTVEASVRGDAYYVNDREVAVPQPTRSGEGAATRVFPRASIVTSLPVVKPMKKAQVVIEPVAALVVSQNINSVDSDIPNEDSRDVQLDATNLFDLDHFPGLDRIEDGSHATYGLRSGLYGHEGSYIDVFAGQSYRFQQESNPFPEGSGLAEQSSDIVGQISGVYGGRAGINYRFQLDSNDFGSERHEVDAFANGGRFSLGTRYLFAKALEGTDISENREQIRNALGYNLTSHWRVRGMALHDLGDEPGLRKAAMGIDYMGCCLSFSSTVERTLTADSSGDSGTEVMFRLGLKGLGDFNTQRQRQNAGADTLDE